MTRNYLSILAETIRNNWDQPALTDFYLTEDGTAQDTSRGNHYTYGEMYAELCHVAELLTSLGLKKGDHIAICGANSAHWVIAYLAIAKMQGVSVTVMHTLMPDEIVRLVAFSDAKALFTDPDIWAELKSQPMPQVENIISLENFESLASRTSIIASIVPGASSETSASSPSIVGFPQLNPDSLAMICFTSGSTNGAKGVMLSYRSISANIAYTQKNIPTHVGRSEVCSLPLAHMFSLTIECLYQITWGTHVYLIPLMLSSATLFKAYSIVKPRMIMTVPFVLDKVFTNYVLPVLERPIIKFLWHIPLACRLVERKLYQQLQLLFGGNVSWLITGGAAVNTNIEKIFRRIHFPFVVGYGMTEAGPLICYDEWYDEVLGCCGKVVDFCELKIQNNGEENHPGEILFRGDHLMLGYYKQSDYTAHKMDSEGWFHTGDVGYMDKCGRLFITGRMEQDIIVLPNGENIRPDNIESLINALPEVSESIVLARDGKLVAIVVPSSESRETSETSETRASSPSSSLRRKILRAVNPQLPLFSQLYDVEITDQPLARTEKQTLKRYLYS